MVRAQQAWIIWINPIGLELGVAYSRPVACRASLVVSSSRAPSVDIVMRARLSTSRLSNQIEILLFQTRLDGRYVV